jgi:hypothetical protein
LKKVKDIMTKNVFVLYANETLDIVRSLMEIKHVRQIANEGYRRWFTDESFDLIVWFMDEEIQGFQLCYDSGKEKRAITWRLSLGYSHEGIDDGERVFRNKMTPVLVANGTSIKTSC